MNNQHLNDQIGAASAHARSTVLDVAEMLGTGTKRLPFDAGTDPITTWLQDAVRGVSEGRTNLCPHLGSPQPAFWAAWIPSQINCVYCYAAAGAAFKGSEADHTCDGCGRYAPSTVRVISVQMGPFVGSAALCRRCRSAHSQYEGLGETV